MSNLETATHQSIDEELFVTITKKEYDCLLEESTWLSCLEAAGVDNWDGFGFARELQEDLEEDSN